MPKLCCLCFKNGHAIMHRFPNPDKYPEKFVTWVRLAGGKLETALDYDCFKNKVVCDMHFTDKDINRNKRLNALAVPSLHLPGTSKDFQEQVSIIPNQSNPTSTMFVTSAGTSNDFQEQVLVIPNQSNPTSTTFVSSSGESCYDDNIQNIEAEHNYSKCRKTKNSMPVKGATHRKLFSDHGVQRSLQEKIRNLQSELCRLRKNKTSFTGRLAAAETASKDQKLQMLLNKLTKPAQLFIKMQLQSHKKPKGRRFATDEKILSLSLYKKSPKCYSLLSKYFSLPSAKAMKRLVSQIKLSAGINNVLFEKIKTAVAEKPATERLCSLIFDEMSLTPQIFYNSQKDAFEGFANNQDNKFADHVLVFMVKGLKNNFKQPIAYYFTSGLNKIELKNILKDVITQIQKTGLIIINTVCDQSTINVGAITEMVNDARIEYQRRSKQWRHDVIYINNKEIIPIYDAPHLIKGIRNNLLTKHMIYEINGKQKIVKWEYYQKLYAADKSFGELRLLDKITEEHINPDKINKMRVKMATQIFSHSVAVATEHLVARGNLPQECHELVEITLLLDNLFDSLNVNTFHIPNGKIYKGPIRKHSPHHQLWIKAKEILKTVKFLTVVKNYVKEIPSIKNLIKTIEGIEAIWQVLSQKYNFDVMLTRNFNQDPIENFFGNIRTYGVRNVAPNSSSFEGSYKSLLLNNFNVPHSVRANCEDDRSECLQNLKFFLTEKVPTSDVPEKDIIINDELLLQQNRETDAGQSYYVCGWVLTKFLKKIKKCSICRKKIINTKDKNINDFFTKRKEYKKSKKWLCYPNEKLQDCFNEIQHITHTALKKNVQKNNIRRNIIALADIFIQFNFTCDKHLDIFKNYFVKSTINVLIYSWCRSINRILSGKITYQGDDELKNAAQMYYNKRKHYKNKK